MTKKLIDILPQKKKISLSKKIPKKTSSKKSFPFLSFFLFSLAFLLFLFFLFTTVFAKVKIQVQPKINEISFEEKIFAKTTQKEINVERKEIPAQIFEINKEIEEKFPATGKKLKKAQGKIKVYNAYTTQDEVWRAGTRFISSEGKIFLAKQQFVVPGAKYVEGKLQPSFVEIEVEAAEGGAEYNIGPSKFSVVAFKGTERYFKFWGESTEPMKGGGEVKVVTKEDLEKALSNLKEKLEKQRGKEILEREISPEFLIPEKGFTVEILEQSFSAKEGDETESFNLKVKFKIKTPLVKKDDLQKLLSTLISQKISNNVEILPGEKISILETVSDFQEGKFLLSVKEAFKTKEKIEPSFIQKEVAGKTLEEAKERLKSLKGIEEIKISSFPFWLKRLPENLERIEVFISDLD